eukprot:5712936-Amphidinium_carterae.1
MTSFESLPNIQMQSGTSVGLKLILLVHVAPIFYLSEVMTAHAALHQELIHVGKHGWAVEVVVRQNISALQLLA